MLRPGVHEHEIVARAQQLLFEMGSEQVEAINAVSGDRCNPHPHVFSDRLLRPGDQAFFDVIHSFMGYRTCYYRTFNVGGDLAVAARRLQAVPRVARRRDRPRPARDDHRRDRRRSGRRAEELGFPSEEACFGLQFGHGVGVGLYEPPMISRVHSLRLPRRARGGHGLRARDVLRRDRRALGGADRGGGRRDEGRQPRAHAASRRGAARRREDLRARRRPPRRDRVRDRRYDALPTRPPRGDRPRARAARSTAAG